jgi:hypothetical protein
LPIIANIKSDEFSPKKKITTKNTKEHHFFLRVLRNKQAGPVVPDLTFSPEQSDPPAAGRLPTRF